MLEVIFSKSKETHGNFWTEISKSRPSVQLADLMFVTMKAASVPARPIIAVYHHIHRAYNPLRLQGKWTKEEDATLIR